MKMKDEICEKESARVTGNSAWKIELDWFSIFRYNYFHYWLFVGFSFDPPYGRFLFLFFWLVMCGLGITAGAHRLWSHRSYKANLSLRIFLAVCSMASFQDSIYEWSMKHRLHHKFNDTDADPHNSSRGLFFAHMGWMCVKFHPEVEKHRKKLDLSDLEQDAVVMFQKKHFWLCALVVAFITPISILMLWGTTLHDSLILLLVVHTYVCHAIWGINSYTHRRSNSPYDKSVKTTDSVLFSILVLGAGFHNYHHVFPFDYRSKEDNAYWCNWTTAFIDAMAKIGWATNLKMMSDEAIKKRILRTGDGSHPYHSEISKYNNNHSHSLEMRS